MILHIFYSQLLVSNSNKIDIQSISGGEPALKKQRTNRTVYIFDLKYKTRKREK